MYEIIKSFSRVNVRKYLVKKSDLLGGDNRKMNSCVVMSSGIPHFLYHVVCVAEIHQGYHHYYSNTLNGVSFDNTGLSWIPVGIYLDRRQT